MTEQLSSSYYLRLRGKVQGPFTIARLRARHQQGLFSRFYEVSTDRINWHPASSIPGFFGSTEVEEAPTADSLDIHARDQSHNKDSSPPPLRSSTIEPSPENAAVALTPRNIKIALGVGALCVLVMAAALPLFNQKLGGLHEELGSMDMSSEVVKSLTSQPIYSVEDNKLENAVGKVVYGLHFELPGGVTKDLAIGSGTGFLISAEGDTLTNQHVIKTIFSDSDLRLFESLMEQKLNSNVSISSEVWIFYEGQPYPAEVAYADSSKDFAILKTDYKGSSFFTLSSNDNIEKGANLRAYGFPAAADVSTSDQESLEKLMQQEALATPGLSVTIADQISEDQLEATLTSGIVGRVVEKGDRMLIQHDAAISPGNSGGPLLSTSSATVVGINTMYNKDAQGIFFSVTLPQLRRAIDEFVPGAVWR